MDKNDIDLSNLMYKNDDDDEILGLQMSSKNKMNCQIKLKN